ncbi:MAG: Crp/Fnr family transcriptional regulator [Bacteriovoracaceae bacterium]|jgi:CRP-like cAMP-binding protein|nr:Crp/Fnr family transcriptional regulator [Bacteriovoracaceae bacterium]
MFDILNLSELIFSSDLISQQELEKFKSFLVRRVYKKGDYLVKPGQDEYKFFIVKEGVLRNFIIGKDGKEHTKNFHSNGGILGPYMEYLGKTKTIYYIEAVTNTTVDMFCMSDILQNIDDSPGWTKVLRKMAEISFLDKEHREVCLLTMDVKSRYEQFCKRFAPFYDQIPKYMIASYIGSTPEGLSRSLK